MKSMECAHQREKTNRSQYNALTRALQTSALALLLCAPSFAADWAQWRGPSFNGVAPESTLPSQLDPAQNLAWATEMPGPSAATPIIKGERIFVASLDRKTKNLMALCLNRKDGKVLWQHEIGPGLTGSRSDLAACSPVAGDNVAIFLYGSGDVAAFDFEGKSLWKRNLQNDFGKFNVLWLYGASGLLHDGKYIVPVLHRAEESYLLAMNPQTGKDIWRVIRPTEAVAESKESYTTPLPIVRDGKTEIVLAGGDCVTGHDPQSGKELWRIGGWNPTKIGHWRLVTSPVEAGGLIVTSPPKNGAIFAFKPGDAEPTWKNAELTSDVCTPLFYNGNLYVLDGDKKKLFCADPQSGQIKWTHDLGGRAVFRASPTAADGKIYCINEAGEAWVLSAKEPKTLHQINLEGPTTRATIVPLDGHVFVRTADRLLCFK